MCFKNCPCDKVVYIECDAFRDAQDYARTRGKRIGDCPDCPEFRAESEAGKREGCCMMAGTTCPYESWPRPSWDLDRLL
jgi:hypothetical protein